MDEAAKYRLLLFSVALKQLELQYGVLPDGETLIRALEVMHSMDKIARGVDPDYGDTWTYRKMHELYGMAKVLAANAGRAGYGVGAKWPSEGE